jgi:hypothetical protein
VVYVLTTGGTMYAYNESGNSWSTVAGPHPTNIYYANFANWRGKLVFRAGNMVKVFDPATKLYNPDIPLPSPGNFFVVAAGTPTPEMYAVGYNMPNVVIYKYSL